MTHELATDDFRCSTVFVHAPPLKAFADRCCALLMTITPDVSHLFAAVIELLWPAVSAGNSLVQNTKRRQATQEKYHQIIQEGSCNNAVVRLFSHLCQVTNLPHMFVAKFTRILFEHLQIRHEQTSSKDDNTAQQQKRLTRDEKNVMRYVGGYNVFRLPRKVKGIPNLDAVIENMTTGAEKDSKLSYTREWMGLQNRGGLCQINDLRRFETMFQENRNWL